MWKWRCLLLPLIFCSNQGVKDKCTLLWKVRSVRGFSRCNDISLQDKGPVVKLNGTHLWDFEQHLFGAFKIPDATSSGIECSWTRQKHTKMTVYQQLIWEGMTGARTNISHLIGFHVWPLTPSCPCVRSRPFEVPFQFPQVATWIDQLLTIEPCRPHA